IRIEPAATVGEESERGGVNASLNIKPTTPATRASSARTAIATVTRRCLRDFRLAAATIGGQTGLGTVVGGAANGRVLSILSTGGAMSTVRSMVAATDLAP